jgi:hypothetical protein
MAFVVFFAATFSVAPMAFCLVKAEVPVTPTCCPVPFKKPPHSEPSRSNCPICKFNYCKLDPNPILKTSVHHPASGKILAPDVQSVAMLDGGNARPSYSYHFFDSSPPLYLRVCVFRI